MATNLGQAYVQIMPSAKGISGSISNALSPEASSAGSSAGGLIGGKLIGVLGSVIAAAKIGEMITKAISSSISEGAALQQSLGGVETLFKDNANLVKKYADEAYKTTGLSANAYMESVTGFSASLLQSLGGDTAKAAKVANMAMIDMADNSNKMGTSMESIQYAYQGFAKQNYTMLDNLKLGYGGTQEEMKRLLADAQKLTGKKYDISNLSDVYEAIHAIQGKIGITGTTAKEAATTFTGSFEAMKAASKNLLGKMALGEDIKPSLKALFDTT
ncbi:TPA: PblA, partial [Streptococcus agalactiae]|nr:PblA [Streptococcus agalactiae]